MDHYSISLVEFGKEITVCFSSCLFKVPLTPRGLLVHNRLNTTNRETRFLLHAFSSRIGTLGFFHMAPPSSPKKALISSIMEKEES